MTAKCLNCGRQIPVPISCQKYWPIKSLQQLLVCSVCFSKNIIILNQFNQPVKLKNIGRNSPCVCGSGKKYKKCCLNKYLNYNK